MKLVLAFLLAAVALLAEPLTVGSLSTTTDQYGIIRPVITNNTANARFFDSTRPLFWQLTQTFPDGTTSTYGDVWFGTLMAGQSLTVQGAQLNAPWIGATRWSFTWFSTEMFNGPSYGLVFFRLAGSPTWYYAQDAGLTGSISNTSTTGPVRVNNVIANCWADPYGPTGCTGGPQPMAVSGFATIQVASAVPEPGTWAMLALGAGLAGVRRWRG